MWLWKQIRSTSPTENPIYVIQGNAWSCCISRTTKQTKQNWFPENFESLCSSIWSWRIEVKMSSFFRWYACVRDMIENMVSETKSVIKVTTHKNSCLFNHDFLSLMTAKEIQKWITEKVCEEMCILPEMGIFTSNSILKFYTVHPPGNSP